MKRCPKCRIAMSSPDICGECGWQKPQQKDKAATGPDHERIARDIERCRARLYEVYTRPRACQERTCMKVAVKGLDFCNTHAQMPADQVRRVGMPKDWKRAAALVPVKPPKPIKPAGPFEDDSIPF